jgi:hypothetical protein
MERSLLRRTIHAARYLADDTSDGLRVLPVPSGSRQSRAQAAPVGLTDADGGKAASGYLLAPITVVNE